MVGLRCVSVTVCPDKVVLLGEEEASYRLAECGCHLYS